VGDGLYLRLIVQASAPALALHSPNLKYY